MVPGRTHHHWKWFALMLGSIYCQWQIACQKAASLYEYTTVCVQRPKDERVNYPTNPGRRRKKSLKPREVIIAFLHRLVLITFLYLSLTSFIKPSHKSCKVRLFSGYLHSSRVIDQRGLQHRPTWMMAFLLFSLHSLLSFYAVIPFSQNHNQAGCRSQIYLQTPPLNQPPLPSPLILLCAALDLTPARSLGWISTR